MVSIADGVRDMAKKIASPDLTVIAAGGAPDGSFGTDSTKICKAVEDADNGKDGVVIITDVGSSIISAGLAIEGLAMDLCSYRRRSYSRSLRSRQRFNCR